MVFYLKVNRNSEYTLRNLQHWIGILKEYGDARAYIVCDNAELKKRIIERLPYIKDYALIINSIKRECDRELVDRISVKRWNNAAYAHLTPFIHARENGYGRYWNIDADDTLLCVGHHESAHILKRVEQYAEEHAIDLFSLDMWRSRVAAAGGEHWSFGITYTNGEVQWRNVMETNSHYVLPCRLFTGHFHPKNIDEFFTYIKQHDSRVNIHTFCITNLLFLHYSDDMILNPITSSVYRWTEDRVIYPIIKNVYECDTLGEIPISHDVVKINAGLQENEGASFLARAAIYQVDTINIIESVEFTDKLDQTLCRQIEENIIFNLGELQRKKVFIFGLCKYTENIIVSLSKKKIDIAGILDNDPQKQGTIYKGISILSPEVMKNGGDDSIVFIDIKYADQIIEQLNELSYKGAVRKAIDYETLSFV